MGFSKKKKKRKSARACFPLDSVCPPEEPCPIWLPLEPVHEEGLGASKCFCIDERIRSSKMWKLSEPWHYFWEWTRFFPPTIPLTTWPNMAFFLVHGVVVSPIGWLTGWTGQLQLTRLITVVTHWLQSGSPSARKEKKKKTFESVKDSWEITLTVTRIHQKTFSPYLFTLHAFIASPHLLYMSVVSLCRQVIATMSVVMQCPFCLI